MDIRLINARGYGFGSRLFEIIFENFVGYALRKSGYIFKTKKQPVGAVNRRTSRFQARYNPESSPFGESKDGGVGVDDTAAEMALKVGVQPVVQNVQNVHDRVVHIGRNDPCPCGSGKKHKKCHGR